MYVYRNRHLPEQVVTFHRPMRSQTVYRDTEGVFYEIPSGVDGLDGKVFLPEHWEQAGEMEIFDTLPAGYRWADEDETEALLAGFRIVGAVQVRVTPEEPDNTDIAVPDLTVSPALC